MDLRRGALEGDDGPKLPVETLDLHLHYLIEPNGTRTPQKESMWMPSQHSPCLVISLWGSDMEADLRGVVVNGRNQGMAVTRPAREVVEGAGLGQRDCARFSSGIVINSSENSI